jgi:flagellin-like hook-associated protein FlgL
MSNLSIMYENIASVNSCIKDVDVAEESAAFIRS